MMAGNVQILGIGRLSKEVCRVGREHEQKPRADELPPLAALLKEAKARVGVIARTQTNRIIDQEYCYQTLKNVPEGVDNIISVCVTVVIASG